MKNRHSAQRLILIAILLILVLASGSVVAYMFLRADANETQFIPAQISCEVEGDFTSDEISGIRVRNTGNISAFLRVRLVTYWVDSAGNVAAISSPRLLITPGSDWVPGNNNTYYYKTPVAAGSSTAGVLPTITLATENGYRQVVDILAEAIQAEPTKAVTDSWGVTVSGGVISIAP